VALFPHFSMLKIQIIWRQNSQKFSGKKTLFLKTARPFSLEDGKT
jgi:hypothetical protein